ncbi:hypothetical protein PHMEG_0008108 [Phytophthora megakarya]|uniref:Uncharacterized protein n=1 Tax=Phytophthora megakarya TaxID=4795 RepID=A0A225WKW9_9STRA|nr:hypothetical protein PHMEG_0008108 [Phytophthora megakarya]
MESIRSSDRGSRWEYDPDDVDFPTSALATVAAGSTSSTMIQRFWISMISDLKEFTGKGQDEDRARAWIGKVKSAFMRDQASDDEKYLLAGYAKNWYRQLSRSTRKNGAIYFAVFRSNTVGLEYRYQDNTTIRDADLTNRHWTTCISSTWLDSVRD